MSSNKNEVFETARGFVYSPRPASEDTSKSVDFEPVGVVPEEARVVASVALDALVFGVEGERLVGAKNSKPRSPYTVPV